MRQGAGHHARGEARDVGRKKVPRSAKRPTRQRGRGREQWSRAAACGCSQRRVVRSVCVTVAARCAQGCPLTPLGEVQRRLHPARLQRWARRSCAERVSSRAAELPRTSAMLHSNFRAIRHAARMVRAIRRWRPSEQRGARATSCNHARPGNENADAACVGIRCCDPPAFAALSRCSVVRSSVPRAARARDAGASRRLRPRIR